MRRTRPVRENFAFFVATRSFDTLPSFAICHDDSTLTEHNTLDARASLSRGVSIVLLVERDVWIKLIRKVIQSTGFQVLTSDEEEQTRKRLEDKARKQLPTGKSAEAYKAMMRARYDVQVADSEVARLEKLVVSDPSDAHSAQLEAAKSAAKAAAAACVAAEREALGDEPDAAAAHHHHHHQHANASPGTTTGASLDSNDKSSTASTPTKKPSRRRSLAKGAPAREQHDDAHMSAESGDEGAHVETADDSDAHSGAMTARSGGADEDEHAVATTATAAKSPSTT